MITFQVERWGDFMADGERLFPLHWEELALDKDAFPPVADHDRYLNMEKMGMLHLTTVRDDGRLIGYAVNFLMTHMHYKSSGLMSMTDMYFLLPEYRKGATGVLLFREMERGLRKAGVVRAHTSCKVHQDHQALFERLGWTFSDKTFSKRLESPPCQ